LFANVASREANAGAAEVADRFFATWSEPDGARRRQALAALATEDLEFGDAFSATRGRDDLVGHIGAAQIFMPGMSLRREGAPRLCQGTALVDWSAVARMARRGDAEPTYSSSRPTAGSREGPQSGTVCP
jgi:hypothetical protein